MAESDASSLTPASMRPVPSLVRLALALLALAGCRAAESAQVAEVAVFRGDARHTGRFAGPGLPEFGGVRWRVQTEGPVRASPVVAGDLVIVGSGDGRVYAVDRATGDVRWRVEAGGAVNGSAAVQGGIAYVATLRGTLLALDLRDGRTRWRARFGPDAPLAWGRESGDFIVSSPVLHEGAVIVGGGDGTVRAFDARTGAARWTARTGGRVRSSPAVADGVVYVGAFDGRVYAFDARTGAPRWTHDTEGASLKSAEFGFDRRSIQSSPAVWRGSVYVGARDGHLYALDAATGARRWRVAHDDASWSIASPAIGDSLLFDASSDARFVHALRHADGARAWRLATPAPVWSSPALVGDMLYFGDGGGWVHGVDARTGAERWRYRTGGPVWSSPAVHGGTLYVGSGDGGIYALAGAARPLERAVFWDSAAVPLSRVRDHARVRDHLRERGYAVLDSARLDAWLDARTADREPATIVFAIDHAPRSATASGAGGVAPLRRFLDAGGTVVWLGTPPGMWPPDASGARGYATIDWRVPTALLGVGHAASQFDRLGARLTADGRALGLDGWWLSSWGVAPDTGITVLASDEQGRAAAWSRAYGGAPGTGFVQLGRGDWPDDALRQLAFVAERRPLPGTRRPAAGARR